MVARIGLVLAVLIIVAVIGEPEGLSAGRRRP
jgi:hypothetical protein